MEEISEIIQELKFLERRVQDLQLDPPPFANYRRKAMYMLNLAIYNLHQLNDELSGDSVMGID